MNGTREWEGDGRTAVQNPFTAWWERIEAGFDSFEGDFVGYWFLGPSDVFIGEY
jgi:hypothetical protein